MKVYWEYMCDFGHSWELFKDENEKETPKDYLCPFGHEAITVQKFQPVDTVQLLILPAGRIIDRNKQKTHPEKKYWIILKDNIGLNEEKKSKDFYSWDEIRKYLDKFHELSKEEAWELWDKLNL